MIHHGRCLSVELSIMMHIGRKNAPVFSGPSEINYNMTSTKNILKAYADKVLETFNAGNKKEALEQAIDLRDKYPQVLPFKKMLGYLISQAGNEVPTSERFAEELVLCLEENMGDARRLLVAAGKVLENDSAFIGALSMLETGSLDSNRAALHRGGLQHLIKNKLFLSLLRNVQLINKHYEFALTNYRKLILHSLTEDFGEFDLERDLDKEFCISLARQCWINEYVYYIDDVEYPLLDRLRKDAVLYIDELPQVNNRLEAVLLTVAMYQPLHELNLSQEKCNLANTAGLESLHPLIAEICRHYQELEIRENIPVIGSIDNEVSLAVKDQYEDNPFPRWVRLPDDRRKTSFGQWVTSKLGYFSPPDFLQQPVRLLVAGCGTGREVILANKQWMTSQILAVDLSRTSLAYAIRMAKELGVADYIEFKQADILGLNNLPKQYNNFDVICCGGVLHHMEDPIEGWQALVKLLRPGGIMRVALYSELGRRCVVKARKCIEDNNAQPTPDGIRHFRRDVFLSRYPELNELWRYPQMYSTSSSRDLLFHVKEWRFNIEDIKKNLRELNLHFMGFIEINESKQDYRRMFPEDTHMTNLDNWSYFESKFPDTFQSMYVMLVQKS